MKLNKIIRNTALIGMLACSNSVFASNDSSDLPLLYAKYAEKPSLTMDFTVVNQLLHAGVLDMGRSTRARAKDVRPGTGTRMRQTIDQATDNEANRFFFENLKKDQAKILKLRKNLENIPSETPLHLYTKEQQLAYWLNLYNVTVINEIAQVYPLGTLKYHIEGKRPLFDEKLLNVAGVALSLNDIHYKILPELFPNEPLVIYGLYQGYRGSPNIRGKAYTGENVFAALTDNAEEFINSNRGTQFNGKAGSVRISSYYKRNAQFFPDFENDVRKHLLTHASRTITDEIKEANTLVANISNFRTSDIYGSFRQYDANRAYSPNDRGMRTSKSYQQMITMSRLLRVRAVNLGGGKVTVTDLDSQEEKAAQQSENN